ncbi:MAG TPA: hypothetical protein VFE87_00495 [Candidatus Paceibacterota bacterium]|nr:hypothetical protein [Candidatus Paceibacterota bacterium]
MKPLIFETYISVIKNSVGSKSFRNFYVFDGRKKIDIAKNGDLSCAWFVSIVLNLFDLIDAPHLTVKRVERELKASGWREISKPKPGAIIIWGPASSGKEMLHRHIGFYVGSNKAISNDSQKGYPAIHDWKFRKARSLKGRAIEAILWNPKLDVRV